MNPRVSHVELNLALYSWIPRIVVGVTRHRMAQECIKELILKLAEARLSSTIAIMQESTIEKKLRTTIGS